MSVISVYGYKLRYVRDYVDIILPDDHNNVVNILWKIYYELYNFIRQYSR